VNPYAAIAAALIAAGLISWSIRQDTGKPLAANKLSSNAVRERKMVDEADEARALAGIYLFAARQLGEILEYVGDDQLRFEFYSRMKTQLTDWADVLSPPGEPEGGWPEGPNMAKVYSLDAYRARHKG
jgi:hypothetical protein